ncbi:MAG: molybdenum cofactor guanylyltransferase, partial [Thermoleophilaceae bacterium]|nr:molybdenum cofactor guanylyltransferase [Thermoleophilaceae bacterium]
MVGAILAGGAGRRMGGGKAARPLAGRPLLARPADALAAVCSRVVVVCKPGTVVPPGPWEVWDDEPPEPRHPATGIAHALGRAGGAVLVCAADMPFVTAAECASLVAAASGDPVAVVAATGGELQPVLAVYGPEAAAPLRAAAERGEPLRRAAAALDPLRVELPAAA